MREAVRHEPRWPLLVELRERPVRVVVREARERGQRLELAVRLDPASHVWTRHPLPRLEPRQHVEVPQREELDGQVEHRVEAEVRQVEKPLDAAQQPRRVEPARRELRLEPTQQRRVQPCLHRASEHRGVPPDAAALRRGAVEAAVDPLPERAGQPERGEHG